MTGGRTKPGGSILLVEDDPAIRDLLTGALRRTGHEVVAASNGPEACEYIKDAQRAKAPIGVLVTDVVMPGMNGFTLAQHAQHAFPQIRVVFISGYLKPELPPGVEVLHKPFSPEDLFRLVSEDNTPDRRPGH